MACFCRTFSRWHAVCIVIPAMLKIQLHNRDSGFEPAPRFASNAEIELADRLRRQLEERYFETSAALSTSPMRSGKDH
jgi:hypothetical protein